MAPHDLPEGRRQGRNVEIAAQADGQRHVVDRASLLETVQEPQALLGEGEREVAVARGGPDRRRSRARAPRGDRPLDLGRQIRQDRLFEHLAQGEVHPEDLTDPEREPRREERVPAQVKEALVRADALDLQNLPPDPGKELFDRRPRRDELDRGLLLGRAGRHRGRCPAPGGDLVPLHRGEERQLREAPAGIPHHLGQERQEAGEEAGSGRRVEELAVVLQRSG
jgi:hypothetical protein